MQRFAPVFFSRKDVEECILHFDSGPAGWLASSGYLYVRSRKLLLGLETVYKASRSTVKFFPSSNQYKQNTVSNGRLWTVRARSAKTTHEQARPPPPQCGNSLHKQEGYQKTLPVKMCSFVPYRISRRGRLT